MGEIPAGDWRRKPALFFAINVTSMTLLLIAVLIYSKDPEPSRLYWTFSFQSVVPLWVPWAGALGGATISLVGIVKHATDWDPGYWLWHLARPLLGGVSGTIGVLIVVLVIKSVVASPVAAPPGAAPATAQVAYDGPGIAILAVMAFVIGFREETFRHLIERVADVILGPGQSTAADVVAFVPRSLELVTTGATPASAVVHLFNGSSDPATITAASLSIEPAGTGFAAVLASEDPVSAGDSRTVTVTWAPAGPSTASAVLKARLGGHTAEVQLRGVST
jgi:hypothetical protein